MLQGCQVVSPVQFVYCLGLHQLPLEGPAWPYTPQWLLLPCCTAERYMCYLLQHHHSWHQNLLCTFAGYRTSRGTESATAAVQRSQVEPQVSAEAEPAAEALATVQSGSGSISEEGDWEVITSPQSSSEGSGMQLSSAQQEAASSAQHETAAAAEQATVSDTQKPPRPLQYR